MPLDQAAAWQRIVVTQACFRAGAIRYGRSRSLCASRFGTSVAATLQRRLHVVRTGGASDGVIHSSISLEAACLRAAANNKRGVKAT